MPKVVTNMKFSFWFVIAVISLTTGCHPGQDCSSHDPITFALEHDSERFEEEFRADYEDYPEKIYKLTETERHKIWMSLISGYTFSRSYGVQNPGILKSMEKMAEKEGSTVALKFDSTLSIFAKETVAHRYFPNQKDSKGFPTTSPVYFFLREMSIDRNSATKIRGEVFSNRTTALSSFPIPGTYPDEVETWILESTLIRFYQKSRGLPNYAVDVDMAQPANVRSTPYQEKLNILHFLMWQKYISKSDSTSADFKSASILTKEVAKWGLLAPTKLNTYIQRYEVKAQPEELTQYQFFVRTCKK